MVSLERTRLASRLIAACVAVTLATPVAAAPAEDPALAEATRLYERGTSERDAGNYVGAAESFDEAYEGIPAASREIRAAVLFDLVDARRNAYAEGEGPAQLCECERRLVAYQDEIKKIFGVKGERFPDTRKAKKLLVEVRTQIENLKPMLPDLDCTKLHLEPPAEPPPVAAAPPEKPPEPEKPAGPDPQDVKRRKSLTIAGGALVGVGGVMFVVMVAGLGVGARAERDGEDATAGASEVGMPLSEDDAAVQDAVRRGKLGNGLAIAGGVVGGVALAVGATLLVLARRPAKDVRRALLAPSLAPGFVGGSLQVRF